MTSRCPDCQDELRPSGFVRVADGDSDTGPTYQQLWWCPNAKNHGHPVECSNCGAQVPNPRYHYYSVRGRIGSGRWTCMRPLRTVDAIPEQWL